MPTACARWVDLARYPVEDADWTADYCARRRHSSERACYALAGFLTPTGVDRALREIEALLPVAYARDVRLRAYRDESDGDCTDDDPRRRRHRFRMRALGGDQLPDQALVARLFAWPALTRLVSGLTGTAPLHRCADPLLSCVVTVMEAGGEHGWHFDDNDVVASLLIEAPQSGGHFELVPEAASDPRLTARVMDGDRSSVLRPELSAGSLAVFDGRRGLHRVSPIEAGRRIIALFSYDRCAGLHFPESVRMGVLGRSC